METFGKFSAWPHRESKNMFWSINQRCGFAKDISTNRREPGANFQDNGEKSPESISEIFEASPCITGTEA